MVPMDINEYSIPVEVNGKHVKAFVDSGAQQTISELLVSSVKYRHLTSMLSLVSPECAEGCGLVEILTRPITVLVLILF